MSSTQYWLSRVKVALESRSEANDLDFKVDISENNDRLKEHINAFGNFSGGGVFVFGINKDFSLSEKQIDHDAIIQKISNLARDTQTPELQTIVHYFEIDTKRLLGIEVLPGSKLPVFIEGRNPWASGAFIRNGNSTRLMNENEIRDLMARSQDIHIDSEPIEESVDNLDKSELQNFLKPFSSSQKTTAPSNLALLIENKVIVRTGASYSPTLAGWLMFAGQPQKLRYLSKAIIEFQQFAGATRETPIRKLEISGSLPQQVLHASSTLLSNIWKVPKIKGIRREDIPSYDETTLREVITNSVVHRDYRQMHQPVKIAMFSDRIEVENPGGLLPGLTPLSLLNKRAWRNETLAHLMMKAGLGEMDGQGIDRIYGSIRRLNIPAPLIIADQRTFKIILSGPKEFNDYSPQEKRLTLLVLLLLDHEIENETVRSFFKIDMMKASNLLKELVVEEMIYRKTKSMKFAKYALTEKYIRKIEST